MWTLDELVDRVRSALAGHYSGAPNGRVRDVPDRRAIRWYTTIGLVDRPLGMRGRTALYGPRHLEQLVAIKRRQADGRSLADIQTEFSQLTPDDLTVAARVPADLLVADGPQPDPPAGTPRHHFWTERPAAAPPIAVHPARADPPALTDAVVPVHGVALGGGAILLIPRPISDRDSADLAAAATPLLDFLATRGLIDGRTP